MTQYAEMNAHQCQSVHVQGVGWPDWVDPEDRDPIFLKRKSGILKKSLLAFLDRGGSHSSQEVNDGVGGPITSTRTCLLILATAGEVEVTVSKNWQRRPINIYTRSDKCKLH